jgi:uncharacterized repeat protein (TIGR01451 family)
MMIKRGLSLFIFTLLALVLTTTVDQPAWGQATPPAAGDEEPTAAVTSHAQLAAQIQQHGAVPLIVELNLPGYNIAAFDEVQAAAAQTAAIASAQQVLLERLNIYGPTNVKQYDYFPYLALTVSSEQALAALAADPLVIAIDEDKPLPPLLDESVPLIRAHHPQGLFYRGDGQTVAILDTGVDKNHPALAGRVVSEACYSTNNASQGASSLCPGGAASSVTNNSALACASNISSCDHGTHVAAIAAGVAPAANLIAIQVFSRFTDGGALTPCANVNRTSPCTLSYGSDQLSALNRVYALRLNFTIAAVNMSLGGGQFTASCNTDPLKPAVDLLRNAGIATVIAAGNSGFTNAMGAPACISTAVSVGATSKSDQVASFSNVSAGTTLWAPGTDIYAAIPAAFAANPTTPYQAKQGTSMAAPHVAGAFALFKQAKPSATVAEVVNLLTTTGPPVSDGRFGGSITKRRLDAYLVFCGLISCDADDYRFLTLGQSINGSISPANDRDHYYLQANAGSQLTLQMVATAGTLDPYLELFNPNGQRVAFNNNGGGGVHALINGYTLQQSGRYLIIARGANSATGGYSLSASAQALQLNPTPLITSLSPGSATGTLIGSDFWVRLNGQNFTPQTQVYWNGALRSGSYTSSTRFWMRVRGSDLGLPWPRTAQIHARNPQPGGGASNQLSFNITFPFLGESELVQPAADSMVTTGISTTFVISWTHPDDSWRTMQNMDLRLRDQDGRVAAWVRIVERPGETSVYRLLNAAEGAADFAEATTPDEGLPGEDRNLVITDTVTLHLAASAFSGSGRTAIMTPTVSFGPAAVGRYNIEFRVDGPDGEVQDDDVLGQITIVPQSCPFAVTAASLSGPATGTVNTDYIYTASVEPPNATQPITYSWAPEPKSCQGTSTAVYSWPNAGEQFVFIGVENCGSFAGAVLPVQIRTSESPDLAITKHGPATALAGEAITYTLTITNSGALTATGLVVLDELPPGATYLGGGSLVGESVRWDLAQLPGFGGVAQVTYTVAASMTITNSSYAVSATGGFNASGAQPVVTRLVDAQAEGDALTASLLQQDGLQVEIPAGAVFAATRFALERHAAPRYPLPSTLQAAGLAFRLVAYQANRPASELTLGEAISLTVAYSPTNTASASNSTPTLYAWDGTAWTQTGLTCTQGTATELHCLYTAGRLTDFALVTAQTAGVAWAEQSQSASTGPGMTVVYTLAITNTGTGPDTFDLTSAGSWTTTLSLSNTGELAPGAAATIVVSVTPPLEASDQAQAVTTITATSRLDGSVQATASLTTTVVRPDDLLMLYLPAVRNDRATSGPAARITGVEVTGNNYRVHFATSNFTPQLPGTHLHFFFDTVPPEEAGMPGNGPWKIYGGTTPFGEASVAERPEGATAICLLVANVDHTVRLNTGNCAPLP